VTQQVLTLRGVKKTYGSFTAVKDLSFHVDQGSIFGFLGPNGAGKTTTLRMILDIIRPTAGQIDILGASSALQVRQRIGYLPEERGLYKKMKAAATIAYFARLKGMSASMAKRRAHELLERFGLKDFAKSKVEALSKGMAQKVQLLAAVAHNPQLVVLDEPFSGLDPVNQQVLEELILDLQGEGKTIIFSTHVMQHAERLCDRLLLIGGGEKIFEGTLREARAALPRRVHIETSGDVGVLRALPFVSGVEDVTHTAPSTEESLRLYDVALADGTDPQDLLKAAFEAGLPLKRFDSTEPSLHDVFVELVGPAAREASLR